MAQNLTIGPNGVQMAVVMHNSNGVINGAGFALNQYTDQASLIAAIQTLPFNASTGDNTTDIVRYACFYDNKNHLFPTTYLLYMRILVQCNMSIRRY
jgi:hypothetical protein